MSWVILHEAIIIILYSPEQAPMGVAAQAPKLRVGGYTEKVLNYLRARDHPGCEVSCQGVLLKALTENSQVTGYIVGVQMDL